MISSFATTKNVLTAVLLSLPMLAACPEEHPATKVPVTGQEVQWGKDFPGHPSQHAASQPTAAPAPVHATAGSNSWSGGNAAAGQQLYAAKCDRCHSSRPLDGPQITGQTDAQLARIIAHGRGTMPSFMGKLDRQQLLDIIAAIRSKASASTQPKQ